MQWRVQLFACALVDNGDATAATARPPSFVSSLESTGALRPLDAQLDGAASRPLTQAVIALRAVTTTPIFKPS